ncbi:hypothetical protein LCGC14_3146720 [marine sediment metagenome]|uniref:Uncharacterized protein n=1 Tax=marine sediment metagenome TaxID=412755 RepID=A0A0F8VVB6_9ZZZZ|nr:hypothetical protein [bacterium]
MSDSPFDIITKYCLDRGKDFPVRNHAFAIFTQKLKDAIENHKKNNQGKITPTIEAAFQQAQLSDNELKADVAEAERNISSMEEEILRPYRNRSRLKEFGVSVLASILGALIFTALLFGLFVLAEDQVRPIFQRLLNDGVPEQVQIDKTGETPTKDTTIPSEGTPSDGQ